MNEEEFFKIKQRVDALWSQDFPNQKAVLDLQTKVKELETKQLAALQAKDMNTFNKKDSEQIALNNHLVSLFDICKALDKRILALESKPKTKAKGQLGEV